MVRQAIALASAGIGVGIGGAVTLNRIMQQMLFGVTATEPIAYLGVSGLLIGIAVLAAYVPTRRAMRIDPSVA